MDIKTVEKLNKYIQKCFDDAYKTENRPAGGECLRWIVVRTHQNEDVFIALKAYCRYKRVLRRVLYRLENNLKKNFNLVYEHTDDFRHLVYETGQIDPNWTKYMFKVDGKNISLSIIDHTDKNNELQGEVIPAYKLEKLLLNEYNMTLEEFRNLDVNDPNEERTSLNITDWKAFTSLWQVTFPDETLGAYDVTCGPNVAIL